MSLWGLGFHHTIKKWQKLQLSHSCLKTAAESLVSSGHSLQGLPPTAVSTLDLVNYRGLYNYGRLLQTKPHVEILHAKWVQAEWGLAEDRGTLGLGVSTISSSFLILLVLLLLLCLRYRLSTVQDDL